MGTMRICILALSVIAAAQMTDLRARQPDLNETAQGHLPDGQVLEHASRGDFGPFREVIIVLHKERACSECRFGGTALIPQKGASYRAITLPDLRQFDNLTVDNSGAGPVLFADVDADGQKEILILIKGYRKGPGGYPLMVVAVLDWTGTAFARLEKVENYFGDTCFNAAQVRAMINLLVSLAGTYVSETAGVSADLVIALGGNGQLEGTWNAVYGQAHMCDKLTFTLKQSGGKVDLVKAGVESGTDEVIGAMQVTGGKAVIRFLKDLGEFDCGAGHPSVVKLKRK